MRPEGRLRLGTALSEMSRKIGLNNADVEALEHGRAAKKRGRKPSLLRGATGEFMTVKLDKSKRKVHVSGHSGIPRKGSIDKILKGYFAIAKKAKKAGRTLHYTVRVSPDGEAKLVNEAVAAPVTESDALESALAAARERGQVKVAEILKGDDMLTASDFGSLIGASHETVNVKRGRGEVLRLQSATRAVRYPRWQVTDANEAALGYDALKGDWAVSLPCDADELDWVQRALKKHGTRVTARELDAPVAADQDEPATGTARLSLVPDLKGLRKS